MFVVYNIDSKRILKETKTKAAATRYLNKLIAQNHRAAVTTLEDYNDNIRCTKKVRNLMTGKEIDIDVNTPLSCDPSSETYWSM